MSLRLFVYYCMICGAWSGFIGWVLGYMLSPAGGVAYFPYILRTVVIGAWLGLVVAAGLSFLDATFNLSLRQLGKVMLRVAAALLVGLTGGLIGSFIGGSLFRLAEDNHWSGGGVTSVFFVMGWTIVGLLIGASICFFEVLTSLITRKDFSGARKKFIKCALGGAIGGVLGGCIALVLKAIAARVFTGKDEEQLWSPTAFGFVALGACIGLLIGLAQVILKEAWIKVEAGFRPGREMILMKEMTSIGRAEGSDIALFGDSGVEKAHALIVLDSARYYLEDQQSPGGSYVNDAKITGRVALKAGDLIRVGNSVLRFNERAKRKD